METISMKSMELEGELNRRIPCSQVPQIKLESWQEYYEKQGNNSNKDVSATGQLTNQDELG